jgi:hypothetical protein
MGNVSGFQMLTDKLTTRLRCTDGTVENYSEPLTPMGRYTAPAQRHMSVRFNVSAIPDGHTNLRHIACVVLCRRNGRCPSRWVWHQNEAAGD